MCWRCGAQTQLVRSILDTAKGRRVLIYKCTCGEQSWLHDAD